ARRPDACALHPGRARRRPLARVRRPGRRRGRHPAGPAGPGPGAGGQRARDRGGPGARESRRPAIIAAASGGAAHMAWPLVLKTGLMVDGSGGPAFQGDLAVEGDRIAAVGPGLEGARELDCAGLVVTPGFIDTHSHSDVAVLAQPALPMKVR